MGLCDVAVFVTAPPDAVVVLEFGVCGDVFVGECGDGLFYHVGELGEGRVSSGLDDAELPVEVSVVEGVPHSPGGSAVVIVYAGVVVAFHAACVGPDVDVGDGAAAAVVDGDVEMFVWAAEPFDGDLGDVGGFPVGSLGL